MAAATSTTQSGKGYALKTSFQTHSRFDCVDAEDVGPICVTG